MQIIIAIVMLALFTGIGREIYIYKYPEQYFAYKVKKNTEYYLLHPRKNEYTNKQMGYEKLVENINKLAYKRKEDKEYAYCTYDPVDQCTYEISFTGKFKRIKKFIECMQPLLCPDNYLTDVDYNYIFSEIKKKKTTSSYDIGPDYALELTRDDNEDNPYTEYTTSIKMKFFLNPFY